MIVRNLRAMGLSLLLLGGARAWAAPVASGPAAQPFRLGELQLVALQDNLNVLPNDGKVFGVEVGPAAVADVLRSAGAPTDKITLGVDALLVEGAGRVMLFDTGLGPPAHGALPASLAQAGVSPDAVTDVFITHSHGDHVGGLVTADGRLAFPHAVIRMSVKEWAWMQASPRSQAVVGVIASQVKTFEPGTMVAPGVTAVALSGHTPGHVGYEIVSDSERLFDMGDTAHSSIVSLAQPDWAIGYDTDDALGRSTRRATLARLAVSHELGVRAALPLPGRGDDQGQGRRVRLGARPALRLTPRTGRRCPQGPAGGARRARGPAGGPRRRSGRGAGRPHGCRPRRTSGAPGGSAPSVTVSQAVVSDSGSSTAGASGLSSPSSINSPEAKRRASSPCRGRARVAR